jgi:malate synthase
MMATVQEKSIEITAPVNGPYSEILTPQAVEFLGALARNFEKRRTELLRARVERQKTFDQGALPDFLAMACV